MGTSIISVLTEVPMPIGVTEGKGSEAPAQAVQGCGGRPIPGGIQGQAGCGSGQPGLVVGNPEHSRGVETR